MIIIMMMNTIMMTITMMLMMIMTDIGLLHLSTPKLNFQSPNIPNISSPTKAAQDTKALG